MLSGKHGGDVVMGKGIPTSRDESIKAMLARRGEAVEQLNLARESGDRKMATRWQSAIRELDKFLAKAGMNPNA